MKTVTIEILNKKALNLLKDLEKLHLIRLQKIKPGEGELNEKNRWARYKGAMSKQPLSQIDQQLRELRNEWE